jgi:predicted membrane channel-forming protein YqfA (hemolysin III family)
MDRLPVSTPRPSWRKPAGIFLLLLLISVWGFAVVSVAEALPELPWPLKALFFIAAGMVWILPLKPLLRWMETGKWR